MNITEINAAANGERPAVKAIQRGRCQCELKDQLIAAVRELRKLDREGDEITRAHLVSRSEATRYAEIIVSMRSKEQTIDHLLSELDKLEVE